MDVAAASHYVGRVELLLFLTALLAGLLSGDRAVEARQLEPAAVAAAAFERAGPVAEAASELREIRSVPTPTALVDARPPTPTLARAEARAVDERRLE
jgi:hypothetical protein